MHWILDALNLGWYLNQRSQFFRLGWVGTGWDKLDNAFNLCPWFGQSRISLDNVILSLDNVMTFLISSPILDNVAWFWLLTPDYGQFCTFYIHIPKHNGQFRTFCKQSKKSINPSHGNLPLDARKLIFFWNCMNFNWNST